MTETIKDNLNENEFKISDEKSFLKQKEYSTPSITNIGLINKITLAGGTVATADSGSAFSPVS